MASNKLFQEMDLTHKPKRNGYDLGHRVNFTAKAGELLPIMHRTLMVGDSVRLSVNHFTRTAPLDSTAATQIREFFDFFFVPYSLLWRNAKQVHTNNLNNPVAASSPIENEPIGDQMPQFTFSQYYSPGSGILKTLGQKYNGFGLNRGFASAKLMNHLGYTYFSIEDIKTAIKFAPQSPTDVTPTYKYMGQDKLSLYPLLAYQCIYYNFFRNSQWENNVPYNYNVDYLSTDAVWTPNFDADWTNYWDNPTMFDLQYSNYPKDLFFGIFPDAQFGDEAEAEVKGDSAALTQIVFANSSLGVKNVGASSTSGSKILTIQTDSNNDGSSGALFSRSAAIEGTLGILELRKAQFLQKYKEIVGSGDNTYKARIKKIFGVEVSDLTAGQPIYLGGVSSTIKISEIENTNLSDSEAVLRGKGTGSSESGEIRFECTEEPGIIMCIYHAQPIIDYALNALHFDVTKTEFDDYANPVFDQLGFQELHSQYLTTRANSSTIPTANRFLGYTTRYFDYKTSIDVTLGDFRETQKTWLSPLNMDYLLNFVVGSGANAGLAINANFFRVNPAILDPIFYLKAEAQEQNVDGDWNSVVSDQLRIFATINFQAIRPLDYHGVPY